MDLEDVAQRMHRHLSHAGAVPAYEWEELTAGNRKDWVWIVETVSRESADEVRAALRLELERARETIKFVRGTAEVRGEQPSLALFRAKLTKIRDRIDFGRK